MRPIRRPSREVEEGESFYISMTDMMVGVIFIFIIMLSFFALQYRSTTSALTQAKDAQTTALLEIATALQPQPVQAQIDRQHRVVCLPADALVPGDDGRRCFAYSGAAPKPSSTAQSSQERGELVSFVGADLSSARIQVHADAGGGDLSFPADQLFVQGTASLSPNGQDVAKKLAASLAARLPCYGYGGPPATGCSGVKMSVVNVVGQSGFDAFTDAGRQAAALSLQRTVVFHQALTAAQPVLAQLSNAPAGQPGAEPLLRVAAYGQSDIHAAPGGGGQTISIQFQPAP